MPNDLHITLFQSNPAWGDKIRNTQTAVKKLSETETDILILPEMFSTGFSMQPDLYAESNTDLTITHLKNAVQNHNSAICGSFIASDNGHEYYNRFFFLGTGDSSHFYDKRHLFTMGDEPNHYKAGKTSKCIEYKGWRILPLVCYDLRFPGWIRSSLPFDMIICVANWPSVRKDAWLTLLKARAIENQCYVIGVNRTGTDGNGLLHSGNSIVYGPKGEVILDLEEETVAASTRLSWDKLDSFRKKFPVLSDRDNIIIK